MGRPRNDRQAGETARIGRMFSLTVCDHIMIAHSFQGEEFGPAQRLHGATFAIEAEFRSTSLDPHQLLVDIGVAKTVLRGVLEALDYRNLDDLPEFAGVNTTTEQMAWHIHTKLAAACRDGTLSAGGRAVSGLKILLRESPNAWAAYEAPID
jgi:6-pyruvoyl-tetrahydropterin synthase